MPSFAKLTTFLLPTLLTLAASAQTVHVLEVPRPAEYQERHQSDESGLTVSYSGKVPAGSHLYVRIFMDNQANLTRQAAGLSLNQCVQYRYFWRRPVTLTSDGFAIDAVIKIFRSSTLADRDFTLVFEEGDEAPGGNDELKLSKKGITDYFRYAIPMHVYASGPDQSLMQQRAQAATPTVFKRVVDHIIPTVSAHPVTTVPLTEPAYPAISIVSTPCRSVALASLTTIPTQSIASLLTTPTPTSLPVLDLTPHPCGT